MCTELKQISQIINNQTVLFCCTCFGHFWTFFGHKPTGLDHVVSRAYHLTSVVGHIVQATNHRRQNDETSGPGECEVEWHRALVVDRCVHSRSTDRKVPTDAI